MCNTLMFQPFMKAVHSLKMFSFSWMVALIALTGCMTAVPQAPAAPFRITMKSPTQFVVDDKAVESEDLIKVLKKHKVPQNEPLVIEMTTSIPFEAIKNLTQKLATAGYKPFFKSPRHADASAEPPESRRNPSRGAHP